jgi:arginine/lysine/ornithine decarboxylase
MTSICDTPEGFRRLSDALLEIDRTLADAPGKAEAPCPPVPVGRLAIWEAEAAEGRFVSLRQCTGGVSGEYVYAYPPGIPLLTPGELVSPELTEAFQGFLEQGVPLKSTYGRMPEEIRLVN